MKDEKKDLFELMLASDDTDEQFPVFKAFQSYLEAEREKSRRRQSQITICFLVSTIILVVCFCVVGFAFFSKFIEKDNQLTQLLLLERAGIKSIPQELLIQEAVKPAAEEKSAELTQLIDELKKEREALEALKAELVTKQQQQQEAAAAAANKPAAAPVETPAAPVEQPAPKPEVKQEAAVVPPTTSTTTTTTTTSTTTTTTLPPGPAVVEVELPRDVKAKSVPPAGYSSDVMGVVTDNNVSLPWHILLPNAK